MEFKYLNPENIGRILKEGGMYGYGWAVCPGCVFTRVSPSDCVHPRDDFKEPEGIQSDRFCPPCYDTIMLDREPFRLHLDPTHSDKVKELEEIMDQIL